MEEDQSRHVALELMGGGERRDERGSSSQRIFKSETTKMKGLVGWKMPFSSSFDVRVFNSIQY